MRTIAYLGPEKTNTHLAAQKRFGKAARYLHAPTVEDVFRLVEGAKAYWGVVPVENSLEGAVTHTLDRFIDFRRSSVTICGEIEQPIQHYFMTCRNVSAGKIRVVYSHPQALAQCRHWLKEHCPSAAWREKNSTAEAVEALLNERYDTWSLKERSAVGRRELAHEYDLKAVPIPIERENRTRFLVIGRGCPPRGRRNKTSLLLTLKDKPGALYDALSPFKANGINLTKIESRPSKRKAWEYLFFIDFEGHASQPRVKKALSQLKKSTADLRVLGSYPMSGPL